MPQGAHIPSKFTQIMPVDDDNMVNEINATSKKQETEKILNKRKGGSDINLDRSTDRSTKKATKAQNTALESPKKIISLYRPNYLYSSSS